MLSVISIIRNGGQFISRHSGLIVAALFCLALWGLNVRNSQLTATNQRLEQLNDRKDEQINQLRSKNDGLAESVLSLTEAVKRQNEVVAELGEQRSITDRQNRALQNEIRRYLSTDKCALQRVPDDAADRLRENADRIRSGKGSEPTYSGKPTD